jgi:GT2 family glycosyltransferase
VTTSRSIAIIILSWNGKLALRQCLTSLFGVTRYKGKMNVIVVDNGSTDGTIDYLNETYPDLVDSIRLKHNLGFIQGCNIGISHAIEKYHPDYILLLNNDIKIIQHNWLSTMIDVAEQDPQIGIVGPKLIFPDGRIQWCGRRREKNTISLIIQTVTARHNQGFGDLDNSTSSTNFVGDVNTISGACFLIKNYVIDKIGILDTSLLPMYQEDVEYSLRAWRANFRVVYVGNVKLVHYEGYSIEKNLCTFPEGLNNLKRYWALRNSIIVSLKHFGIWKTCLFGFPIFLIAAFFDKVDKTKPLFITNLKLRNNFMPSLFLLMSSIRDAMRSNNVPLPHKEKKLKVIYAVSYPETRVKKEIATITNLGHHPTLIYWKRGWHFQNTPATYAVRQLAINGVPFGESRALIFFPIWWGFLFYWLIKENWDVLHVVNFDSYLITLIIAKLKKKPIIYEISDYYADVVVPPIFSVALRAFIGQLDRNLMKFADAVIIADDFRINQIGPCANHRVISIYNSPNETNFKRYTTRKKSPDKFIIFYGGGVGEDRGIHSIINAIQGLEDVILIIMGRCSDSYRIKLNNLCNSKKNIILNLHAVSYETIIEYTYNADLLFALYDPNIPNNKFASPNKLFEAMMCEKPILVSDNTSMAKIVRNENCGIVVPYGDISSIRAAILRLKENSDLYRTYGKNGRLAYEAKYNWQIMEKRLIDLYFSIKSQ